MKRRWQIEEAPKPGPIIGFVFDDESLTARELRRWPTEKIHVFLARSDLKQAQKSLAEAELRRRDAWRSPAGAAFWVSGGALLVSVLALLVSLLRS